MTRTLSSLLATIALIAGLAVQPAAAAPDAASDGLIAPSGTCPGQESLDAPAAVQQRAMLCMTDFARRGAGLAPLAAAASLDWSAAAKSADILRCNSFSHSACGRDIFYWIRESGYLGSRCRRAAENLAWGAGERGTVQSVFLALMLSPPHRRNILGRFDQIGIGLRVGSLGGRDETSVWTQHFGSHCVSARTGRGVGRSR